MGVWIKGTPRTIPSVPSIITPHMGVWISKNDNEGSSNFMVVS